jgi:hypothetical protein
MGGAPRAGRPARMPSAASGRHLVAVPLVATVVACALLHAGCATPVPTQSPSPGPSAGPAVTLPAGDGVAVSLGIYSGRPDPSWTLSGVQATELRRLIDELPSGAGEPAAGGLGYHGFTIAPADDGGDPVPVVAYHGEIAATGDGARPTWHDAGGSVERFLLLTGRRSLDPEEVRVVADDLDAFFGTPEDPASSE